MNLKNLAMWAVIVFLTVGLYNMFKNPQNLSNKKDTIIFSEFLSEVDNGRVVEVQIQGNNIYGILANGNKFSTSFKKSENIITSFLLIEFCGFLNILYSPIVKKTITAHIAKFFKFIRLR